MKSGIINWIVVAQKAEARIFTRDQDGRLYIIDQIDHPDGRLKNQELTADRPGRSFSSSGPIRHGLAPATEPKEHVSIEFAKILATCLDTARRQNQFDTLTLIAGPHFLGLTTKNLSKEVQREKFQMIEKNLGGFSDHELATYLDKVWEQADSRYHPTQIAPATNIEALNHSEGHNSETQKSLFNVQVNTSNEIHGSEKMNQDITTKIETDLSRFGNRITRVEVHLSDENASKSTPNDKRCVLEARLTGRKPVTVTHHADTLAQAIQGASKKLVRVIDTAIS